MNFRKPLALFTLLAAGALAAGAAQARSDVYWSIGINAPVAGVGVGTVVSNAPVYPSYPVAAVPAYPVYGPPPVVVVPQPVYRPAPRYVAVPVYPQRGYGRWERDRERWERERWERERWEHRHGHGPRHGDRRW